MYKIVFCVLLMPIIWKKGHTANVLSYLNRVGIPENAVTYYLPQIFQTTGHQKNQQHHNGYHTVVQHNNHKNPSHQTTIIDLNNGQQGTGFWAKEGQVILDALQKELKGNGNNNDRGNVQPLVYSRFNIDDNQSVEGNNNNRFPTNNPTVIEIPLVNKGTEIKEPNQKCISSPTHVKGKRQCKGELIFNESFQTIKENIWNIEQKIACDPDFEFVVYVNRPETKRISNGKYLNIKPVLVEDMFGPQTFIDGIDLGKNCTSKKPQECRMKPDAGFMIPPIASTRLSTKDKFSFRYGHIEIRAKLPAGDWIYPILYLNPMLDLYGKYYESGQIRVAFADGNQDTNNILKGGIILGESKEARSYGMRNITSDVNWSRAFHTYQIKWTPESFTLAVDGMVYGKIEPPKYGFVSLISELKIKNSEDWRNGSPLAPFDKEMYLDIGVGVGGFNFEDRTDGTKPWRNGERLQVKNFYTAKDQWGPTWNDQDSSLYVDYIKIWAV